MDNLRGNKIFAAILIGLLVALVSSLVADVLVEPETLAKNVYIIDVPDQPANGQMPVAPKEETIDPIAELLKTADPEAGAKVAKKCVQCHSFEQGGKHRIGPALWGVMHRKQASSQGFAYSSAAQKRAQEGKEWDAEEINRFLVNPRKYMPGTKMSFAGLKKAKDRANVIAYMQTKG